MLADQWKEYFYCESLPADVLAVKGKKRASGRSSNTKGSENVITSGSTISIPKEIIGNKYGTAKPIGFRVVDEGAAIDMDIPIRCFGEYSYRIVNPLLFYTNICSNISEEYRRSELDGALRTDLMTALQTAFAKISAMGIRYSMLAGHTTELTEILKEVLSSKWRDFRGIEIVAFGINSVNADEEVEKEIREMQKEMRREAVYADPTRAAGALARAQAEAMKAAASNPGAGPAMAFMGMGMAGQAGGMNAQNLYAMGQQQQQPAPAAPNGWTCTCGAAATGKFCPECGDPFDDGDIQG